MCALFFSNIHSNCTIFILKICVWFLTGSHSMFAESIHSVADTVNQIILAFGLHKSAKVSIKIRINIIEIKLNCTTLSLSLRHCLSVYRYCVHAFIQNSFEGFSDRNTITSNEPNLHTHTNEQLSKFIFM